MIAKAADAGFARVAACSLPVTLADPSANAKKIAAQAAQAALDGAHLVVFPELALSGYSLDDVFMQNALLDAVDRALSELAQATAQLPAAIVVGAPLVVGHRLYNCAIVLAGGQILGALPKSYLPNYREFYERRQFAAGVGVEAWSQVAGQSVLVSPRQLFDIRLSDAAPQATSPQAGSAVVSGFCLGVEICEDLWVPLSPSASAALAGAEIIANISGSPITVAKARQRQALAAAQSNKLICTYVYAASGSGESSTDLSWDGQTMICERGEVLAQGPRFSGRAVTTLAESDLAVIRQDRLRQGTFDDNRLAHPDLVDSFRRVAVQLPRSSSTTVDPPAGAANPSPAGSPSGAGGSLGGTGQTALRRMIARFPFVPDDPQRLGQDCYEAYSIQVSGLIQRLRAIGEPKIVIGLSGGLDSTQALIVAANAMDDLGRPRSDILAFTLPGFATSGATKANATSLATSLGVTFEEIDIKPAAKRLLQDIGHPAGRGEPVYDITFENVQAGLRTDYLFRIANQRGGIVLGTGDLSELALGWCTYGVGDQMSHYNVNAGVPKTLIQYLIAWVIQSGRFTPDVGQILRAILGTEISPELVPATADGQIQSTEDTIGPYALHDFMLYYTLRFGLSPRQVFLRLCQAWQDPARGAWPDAVSPGDRGGYSLDELLHWMEVFYSRFWAAQFKRSALPNGPKVVNGGALSPRGDWRQPSDMSARIWLDQVAQLRAEFGGQPQAESGVQPEAAEMTDNS
ncbi:MAG: NAD(+) synthase [Bifidobacteriaceae bacterium]|jgi:NAD+ synthase (glutamine-hydrolysing)|nr:NAD(+) synthase [Bifidobacteriaceae bacterium]